MKKTVLFLGVIASVSAFAEGGNVIAYNKTDFPMRVQNPNFPQPDATLILDAIPVPPHSTKVVGSFEQTKEGRSVMVVVAGDGSVTNENVCVLENVWSKDYYRILGFPCYLYFGTDHEVEISAAAIGGDYYIEQKYYKIKLSN